MIGAAIVTAITVSGLFIAGLFQVKWVLGLWPYDRRYIKGGIASILVVGVLLVARPWIESFLPIIQLVVYTIICSVLFIGSLLVLGLDTEDRELIRIVSNRLLLRKEVDISPK